jgi:hypothetical protein
MAFKKRDWLFIALVVVVIGIFYVISGEEKTTRVPQDEIHMRFREMAATEGKKATEKFCKECHNPQDMPLSEGHPPPFRCLFCHKFEER